MKAIQAPVRVSFKNILFCTDFSPYSDAALPYAAECARHFGAKLFGLHVKLEDQYAFVPLEGGAIPPVLTDAQMRDELTAVLDRFPGIEREAILEKGEVWPILASVIQRNQIDLIVVGTHGRTGIKKLLLGSEAERIFRQAPCPVMTVGPQLSMHLPRGGVSEILYATDLSSESNVAAPYAVSLAQEYQARLTLLHVIAPQQPSDLVTAEQHMASSERLMRGMMAPEVEFWCEPHYIVEQGDPAAKILETAERKRADLIVLGVRGRSSLGVATHLPGATAHRVVTRATCPVLTVRE